MRAAFAAAAPALLVATVAVGNAAASPDVCATEAAR